MALCKKLLFAAEVIFKGELHFNLWILVLIDNLQIFLNLQYFVLKVLKN